MPRDCEICGYLSQTVSPLFETKYWMVELSPDQGYLGHSFIELKRHAGSLSELSGEEWAEFHQVIKRFEHATRQAFGAQVFNWACLMNNAFKSPEPKPHVHWKVRPRYNAPVKIGEHVFRDPNFAHHYDKHHIVAVDERIQRLIGDKIKAALPRMEVQ